MADCIFCKINNKELPAEFVYENTLLTAFKDIRPKAPIHILIVPKKHIHSVIEAGPEDGELLAELVLAAQKIARDLKLDKSGYKLVFNVGRGGGQLVDHLHLHLLGGWEKEGLKELP
jgi:histidine triad (HIT) family protein